MHLPTVSPVMQGVLATSAVFSLGIAAGLYLLHLKHEKELDRLQCETVDLCLAYSARHYERILREKGCIPEEDPTAENEKEGTP